MIRSIARVLSHPDVPRVRHYVGFPPELTQAKDKREDMKPAYFLVIEEKSDGVFLNRYANDGMFAGDTWHQSEADAKEQAEYEFDGLSEWREVPPGVDDVVSYAMASFDRLS